MAAVLLLPPNNSGTPDHQEQTGTENLAIPYNATTLPPTPVSQDKGRRRVNTSELSYHFRFKLEQEVQLTSNIFTCESKCFKAVRHRPVLVLLVIRMPRLQRRPSLSPRASVLAATLSARVT